MQMHKYIRGSSHTYQQTLSSHALPKHSHTHARTCAHLKSTGKEGGRDEIQSKSYGFGSKAERNSVVLRLVLTDVEQLHDIGSATCSMCVQNINTFFSFWSDATHFVLISRHSGRLCDVWCVSLAYISRMCDWTRSMPVMVLLQCVFIQASSIFAHNFNTTLVLIRSF